MKNIKNFIKISKRKRKIPSHSLGHPCKLKTMVAYAICFNDLFHGPCKNDKKCEIKNCFII